MAPAPNDYNPRTFEQFLLRVAADKNGGRVSIPRLGLWLRKISGRVVDGYRVVWKPTTTVASFEVVKVEKDEKA